MEVARGNGNVHWTSHMKMMMMMINSSALKHSMHETYSTSLQITHD